SEEEIGRNVLEALDARNRTLELTDHIYATSFDPYASFRSAYLQRRDHEIRNGK
ncbi:MAG: VacJ family lipoprotein, partial [Alphaproteobacteria bacterium]|nr:VacJ family lipoprotein [Alphaproteobacteria bacterium]